MRKLVADIHYYGDEYCVYWYPRINVFFLHNNEWIRSSDIYEGTHVCDSYEKEERDEVIEDYKNICKKYGIELNLSEDRDWVGERFL
jgi:hypothetical protein